MPPGHRGTARGTAATHAWPLFSVDRLNRVVPKLEPEGPPGVLCWCRLINSPDCIIAAGQGLKCWTPQDNSLSPSQLPRLEKGANLSFMRKTWCYFKFSAPLQHRNIADEQRMCLLTQGHKGFEGDFVSFICGQLHKCNIHITYFTRSKWCKPAATFLHDCNCLSFQWVLSAVRRTSEVQKRIFHVQTTVPITKVQDEICLWGWWSK